MDDRRKGYRMSEEKNAQEQKDQMKEMKGTPAMTLDEFVRFAENRMKTDPRYRKGGSRYKERGE